MAGGPGIFFGWRVVGAAFVIAVFAWGIGFYGPPIFLEVLRAERGWAVRQLALAVSLHFLVGAAVVANLGALHRRFSVAAVTRFGAVLTAAGLLGWACAREPWQLLLAMPVSGAGWACTSAAALNAMVSPWFVKRRPAALGMAFNGASLGGVIFAPLWVALIGLWGFTAAMTAVAAVSAIAVWILARRYLSRGPQQMGLMPDGDDGCEATASAPSPRAAQPPFIKPPLTRPWCDRRFITLSAAAALGLFAQIGLVAHLFSVLAPALGAGGAGAAMSALTACAIGGRAVLARLMPARSDRRAILAANLVLQALGSAVMLYAGGSAPWLLCGCMLFGLGLGNMTSLPPLVAQTDFNAADVPRAVALSTALGQACYAFAPALFGLLRGTRVDAAADAATGAATGPAPLFIAALLIQLAATGVILAGRRRAMPAVDGAPI